MRKAKCAQIKNEDNISFINDIFAILEEEKEDHIGIKNDCIGVFIYKKNNKGECTKYVASIATQPMLELFNKKGSCFTLGYSNSPCDCFNFAPCIGFANNRREAFGILNEVSLQAKS